MKSHIVTSAEEWKGVLGRLSELPAVSVDTETTGLVPEAGDKIVGVSVGVPGEAWYCPVRHTEGNVPSGVEDMRGFLGSPVPKVFHNASFDARAFVAETGVFPRNLHDTLSLAAVDDERRLLGKLSLDSLAKELLPGSDGKGKAQDELEAWCKEHGPGILGLNGSQAAGFRRAKGTWKTMIRYAPVELAAPYACMDADLPIRIMQRIGRNQIYLGTERPLLPAVVEMISTPKHLDVEYLQNIAARAKEYEDAAVECSGETNPFSTLQVQKALFSKEGLGLKPSRLTPKKAPSVDVLALMHLEDDHPLPGFVLAARSARKMRTTYCESWLNLAGDRGVLFPVIKNWSTQTGRFSSSDPNLQNVPRGPLMRSALLVPEGMQAVFADYSQIEPRVIAHYTEEPALVGAFRSGHDVYGSMARRLFPHVTCGPDEVKALFPRERQVAKVAVLATFYGAQGKKLSEIVLSQAGIRLSVYKCKRIVDSVRAAFPRVQRYAKALTMHASRDRLVTNMYGRVRHVGGIGGCSPRDAFNTLIQGTAADIMKRAVLEAFKQKPSSWKMTMTIHDELIFESPEGEDASWVKPCMEGVADLAVPLKVDPAVSTTHWGIDK